MTAQRQNEVDLASNHSRLWIRADRRHWERRREGKPLLRLGTEMNITASAKDLVGRKLSNFRVEKLEYPSGSNEISELPIRIWIMTSEEGDALGVSVGPAGCTIDIRPGIPEPVDRAEYGRTVPLPQFCEEHLRLQSVTQAGIEPFFDGEILISTLSSGTEVS